MDVGPWHPVALGVRVRGRYNPCCESFPSHGHGGHGRRRRGAFRPTRFHPKREMKRKQPLNSSATVSLFVCRGDVHPLKIKILLPHVRRCWRQLFLDAFRAAPALTQESLLSHESFFFSASMYRPPRAALSSSRRVSVAASHTLCASSEGRALVSLCAGTCLCMGPFRSARPVL